MPPYSLPPLFYPCSHPHPPHISLYLQFFLLKLGRMKDRRHLCHPSNKTGSWQPWFINDYSALLSQHLEDLCPRRDEPVTCRDRLITIWRWMGTLRPFHLASILCRKSLAAPLRRGHLAPAAPVQCVSSVNFSLQAQMPAPEY